MRRLAVIPSDPIKAYLDAGLDHAWLKDYYNPRQFFDEVYLLSPLEENNPDILGMRAVKTGGWQLRRRIKDLKIDVVRAYGGHWPCSMACLNRVDNVPVVVSVHDRRQEKIFQPIKSAGVVFSVSGAVTAQVLKKFPKQEKIWTLPNRVNFDVMKPRHPDRTAFLKEKYPFKFSILHVGRKREEKNLDTLIKAMPFLGKEYCLIAAGKGPIQKYEQIAESERVRGRCFFIESISQHELADYYSWASCMCTPSRDEGFGIVFIEALASGGVVVTSDISPMNEYIKDGFNGLLVRDYQEAPALADVIRKACTDEGLRKYLKNNARASVLNFEKNKIDLLEASYYEKILEMRENREFALKFSLSMAIKDRVKNLTINFAGRNH